MAHLRCNVTDSSAFEGEGISERTSNLSVQCIAYTPYCVLLMTYGQPDTSALSCSIHDCFDAIFEADSVFQRTMKDCNRWTQSLWAYHAVLHLWEQSLPVEMVTKAECSASPFTVHQLDDS